LSDAFDLDFDWAVSLAEFVELCRELAVKEL